MKILFPDRDYDVSLISYGFLCVVQDIQKKYTKDKVKSINLNMMVEEAKNDFSIFVLCHPKLANFIGDIVLVFLRDTEKIGVFFCSFIVISIFL